MESKFLKRCVSILLTVLMVCSVAVINVSADETDGDGKLKISVVNFDSKWGDVDANVAKMVDYIEKAKNDNVEFLVFPEMCVSGYCYSYDRDLLLESSVYVYYDAFAYFLYVCSFDCF